MSIAEVIYEHSLRLSEQAAREALAFIECLEGRYGVVPPAVLDLDDTERPYHRPAPPPAG